MKYTVGGLNFCRLKIWVAENMPDLDKQLTPLPLGEVRVRLNEMTGLDIPAHGSIEDGAEKFLIELKRRHKP